MKCFILVACLLGAASALDLSAFDVEACVTGGGTPLTREVDATNPQGIATPGFNFSDPDGSTYPANTLCQWHIFTAPGQELELSFFNFSIEFTTNCVEEYVSVWDGADDTAPLARTVCGELGDVVPDPIVATGTDLYVRFFSNDDAEQLKGFLARVGFPLEITACDGTGPQEFLTAPGFFATVNYPVNYGNGEMCEYLVTAPAGMRIEIGFTDSDIEECCTCDFLEAHDGATQLAPVMSHWYGDTKGCSIRSSGNQVYLRFQSDFSVTGAGFLAFFNFI